MGASSSKFVNDEEFYEKRRHQKDAGIKDTNVLTVAFKELAAYKAKIVPGDPIFCTNLVCRAVLNNGSKVLNADLYIDLHKDAHKPLQANERIWICEFCGEHNTVKIEDQEVPKGNDIYYLIKPADAPKEKHEEEKKAEAAKESAKVTSTDDPDITVIFALDISGSMAGKQLERLQNAVIAQIDEMAKNFPERKVGIVTFGNTVTIHGDCSEKPIAVTDVSDFSACQKTGQTSFEKLVKRPLRESHKDLKSRIPTIRVDGRTALGPAALVSVGLAMQGRVGSQVILCTDGLANIGLGPLETEPEKAIPFYERIGNLAKECGITVSIIAIAGSTARLDILGRMVEFSNGLVTRVAATGLSNDFGKALKDELLATEVMIEGHLHMGLKFRGEDPSTLYEKGSILKKFVGNVTALSEVAVEYEMKTKDELKKDAIDVGKLTEVPFQGHIYFTTPAGEKCLRVITIQQKTTKDEKAAEEDANLEVLAKRGVQKAAIAAANGDLDAAKKMGMAANDYVQNLAHKQVAANKMSLEKQKQIDDMQQKVVGSIDQLQQGAKADQDESHAFLQQARMNKLQ